MAKTNKAKSNPDDDVLKAIIKRHALKDAKAASIEILGKELNIRLNKKAKARLRGRVVMLLYRMESD